MSGRKGVEEVETYVLLPYNDFKSMDQRVKKAEEGVSTTRESSISAPTPETRKEEVEKSEELSVLVKQTHIETKKKDLSKSYCKTLLKTLIQQIWKTEDSKEIIQLENLDALIESALNNSKKTLLNEEIFFQFLFQNGMSQFVKNHFKINLYFDDKDNWLTIWADGAILFKAD